MQKAKPDFEDIGKFIKETAEADFLFEPEIANYLHEIRNHANDLRIFSEQYRDSNQLRPEGYNHAEIVDGMHRELSWLAQQFEPKAKEKFAKYLSIGK